MFIRDFRSGHSQMQTIKTFHLTSASSEVELAERSLPSVSGAELVRALTIAGAVVVGEADHGTLLRVVRHLVFVRNAHAIDHWTLVDALRAAGITPARFRELIDEIASAVRSKVG
jgi:hypothetical protein